MNILCVIPARSGSKAIKDKNIKLFKGKPLLAHSIEYAKKSDLITETIISTDSKRYAKIAEKYGGNVPFLRPKDLAKDLSQDIDFIYHALVECERIFKLEFHYVILLRPTSPLRPEGLIEKGMQMIASDQNASSLKSVTVSNEHPYRQWKIKDANYISGYETSVYEPYNLPRQSLPKAYYSSGELEIIKRTTIIDKRSVSGDNIIPLILDPNIVSDIDTDTDWLDAENRII